MLTIVLLMIPSVFLTVAGLALLLYQSFSPQSDEEFCKEL